MDPIRATKRAKRAENMMSSSKTGGQGIGAGACGDNLKGEIYFTASASSQLDQSV
jgi:hypothetical protein